MKPLRFIRSIPHHGLLIIAAILMLGTGTGVTLNLASAQGGEGPRWVTAPLMWAYDQPSAFANGLHLYQWGDQTPVVDEFVGGIPHEGNGRWARVTLGDGRTAYLWDGGLRGDPGFITPAGTTPAQWYNLRYCESKHDYRAFNPNGHYGAWQFALGTWAGYGGYADPRDAPAQVQDEAAYKLYRERGWQPWSCNPNTPAKW